MLFRSQEMEQGVLNLERNPTDAAAIDTVFRVFHTFKGNAGVLKLVVLQRLTHDLESVLDAARKGQLVLDRDAIGLILTGGDVLRRYVDEALRQVGGEKRGRTIPLPIPAVTAGVKSTLRARGQPTAVVAPAPATAPVASAVESSPVEPSPPPAAAAVVEKPADAPSIPPSVPSPRAEIGRAHV